MKASTSPILITFGLVCFALVRNTLAVSPAPDGGYPGGNTAEGQSALLSRSTGIYNTAIGIYALLSLTDGKFCTGVGAGTLLVNTDIKPIDKASESILALKPVSFRYKVHKDTTPQFGLIAEEVAAVNPDLVIYDADRKPYTVRYDAVNAMLLNEFLKEHRKVAEQQAVVTQLKEDFQSRLAEQQKQIEALTAGLQKVSAQLEANKSAPQVVNNNQ
jgi:hypothetical protein